MATDYGRLKIALFGNFGTANFGNEATLDAMLHNIRKCAPKAEVACICTRPDNTASRHKIVAYPTRGRLSIMKIFSALPKNNCATPRSGTSTPILPRRNWRFGAFRRLKNLLLEPYRWLKGLSTLWDTDALVIPGTGLLTDAYGLLDWGPYDMFRWSLTAKLCRCKLLFVSVGGGPLYSRAGRVFVKTALWLADFRSYRDESSKQYLRGIGVRTRNDSVFPDLAFSLPETVIPGERENKNGARRLVVGLGLMEYAGKYSVEKPTSAVYAAYLQTFSEFAMWTFAHDYRVRLLVGDCADICVTQELRSLLKSRPVNDTESRVIDERVTSVGDLLLQLASTDFVIATRFHNILLALLLNKPVIAVSFHHKCSSLMSQMGMSEYCQDINDFHVERLVEQFVHLQQNADSIKRMLREKVAACREALDRQYGMAFRTMSLQVSGAARMKLADLPCDTKTGSWEKPAARASGGL